MKKTFLNEDEVQHLNPQLFNQIDQFVNEEIVNWEGSCECEEEGDAMEYALASTSGNPQPKWRVLDDGTLDVIIEGDPHITWDDEDGEEKTSYIPNNLRGNVGIEFGNSCNNEAPIEIEDAIKQLF